jgi:hypothetical protein
MGGRFFFFFGFYGGMYIVEQGKGTKSGWSYLWLHVASWVELNTYYCTAVVKHTSFSMKRDVCSTVSVLYRGLV